MEEKLISELTSAIKELTKIEQERLDRQNSYQSYNPVDTLNSKLDKIIKLLEQK